MPAITFPASPYQYQIFTLGPKSWQWDGSVWNAYYNEGVDSVYGTGADGDAVLDGTTTVLSMVPSSTVYAIGDTGPASGKIFITPSTVGNSTGKYFEVGPYLNPDVTRTWSTAGYGVTVSGADGTAIGTGAQNTIDIVAQSGNIAANSAAAYANDYTYNGYSDWFLPSRDELTQLYTNRIAVGGIVADWYWSSSEYDHLMAHRHYFGSTLTIQQYGKDGASSVRPVRSFTSTYYTMTKDLYFNDLTINAGVRLIPNGYRIFVKGTLKFLGTDSTVGYTAGFSTDGSIKQGGAASTAVTHSLGGSATGFTATAPTAAMGGTNYFKVPSQAITGYSVTASGGPTFLRGGAGGSAQAGGGVIIISARYISGPSSGTAYIKAPGTAPAGGGVILIVSSAETLAAGISTDVTGQNAGTVYYMSQV
jgi:hypothetical protein